MAKPTITRMWLAGLVVLAVGLLVAGVGIALMLAYGGTFTKAPSGNHYDFVPNLDGVFWTNVVGIVTGLFLVAIGSVIQLVAWIGAIVNTYQLPDKTWFAIVLAGGLIGLGVGGVGLAAMVAYLIAGPDGMAVPRQPATTSALAPTT